MRRLLASTCLSPLALIAAGPLSAQTVIDTARTTPVATSTITAGGADIRISSAGSVIPTTPVAVTIDSNHKVTNEGTIRVTNLDDAVGIRANAGVTSGITNSKDITLNETYTPTDADNDGDLDGPFAAGNRRRGIQTLGAFTGNIINATAGTITVNGNDSAGVLLGGPLTGNFTNDGNISVIGDRAVGIRTGAITGNVRIAGTVSARGLNAVGASIDGDITGALVVQGGVGSSGYRATTPPTDTSKLDADDLRQGGSALVIAANVSGGVVLAAPPRDAVATDPDEDKDGIPDASEGTAAVISIGAAPALRIGAADRAVNLGAVAGSGTNFGLIIEGGVSGAGTYSGIEGNAILIGGTDAAVNIANGMSVSGTVQATSTGASATAIRIGRNADVPEIRVSGTVQAGGGGTATSVSTAIRVDAGAEVGAIRNSGVIRATASGVDGTAVAIRDASGGVTLIENSGGILATGATATSDRNIAIDVSATTTGVTVRQTAVAAGVTAPVITGDISFGSGADVLEIADGVVTSTARFGAGANRLALSGDGVFNGTARFGAGADTMTLAGTSVFNGTADFGGGADTLTLTGTSRFAGSLANSGGLAVSVQGGLLDLAAGSTSSIASLAVGAQGLMAVTIDTATKTSSQILVAGDASFAAGAKLGVRLTGITGAEGRYTFLKAGTITGATNLTAVADALPFLFKGQIAQVGTTDLAIDITRKTSTELGLNRSQASAYDAVYTALGKDAKVAQSFLGIGNGDDFRGTLRQMLPDHAGGGFETVTSGSRAIARTLQDPAAPYADMGRWGFWIAQAGWGSSKNLDDTAAYDIGGWGLGAGGEIKTGAGNFGLSAAYLHGQNSDVGTDNEVTSDQWELAGYWRAKMGPVSAHARGSWAHISFDGSRRFAGTIGNEAVERAAAGKWNGRLVSAAGGLSYEARFGRLTFRPVAAVDYYRLREGGYTETGGGDAFNLIVDSRTSDELAVTGTVAAGLDFGATNANQGWFRVEAEGGRRQLVGGSLGSTTARFAGGQSFTLVPEDRTSGWVGRLRAIGGTSGFQVGGEFTAEEQQGRAALALRASLQFAF